MKIHFLSHLESFMWKRKFEKKFFKKYPIQPSNGVLLIFKHPFSNGSYRNGVCRALLAILFGWKSFCTLVCSNFFSRKLCSYKTRLKTQCDQIIKKLLTSNLNWNSKKALNKLPSKCIPISFQNYLKCFECALYN